MICLDYCTEIIWCMVEIIWCVVQGDHIFEKLNSLSSPWDFQDIFNFFPEQLKREKFNEVHFCRWSCHIFLFSLSFPGFLYKSSNFPEFSQRFWQFFKFPEFSRFSMFSRFVATLMVWWKWFVMITVPKLYGVRSGRFKKRIYKIVKDCPLRNTRVGYSSHARKPLF